MTPLPPITIADHYAIFWCNVAYVDLFAPDRADNGSRGVRIHFAGRETPLILEGEDAVAVRRLLEQAAFGAVGGDAGKERAA